PISTGIAGVSMRLKPGGLRELHWHANAAEWAYVIKGRGRTTVIAPDGTSETNDFEPGAVWYFPPGHGHARGGLGREGSQFVLGLDNGAFSEHGTSSVTDWLGHPPPPVLAQCRGMAPAVVSGLPRHELYIVQGRVPDRNPDSEHRPGLRTSPQ